MPDGSVQTVEATTSDSESEPSKLALAPKRPRIKWGKVGVVAAASVLVGGLAVAWWYRKTLKILQQTDETSSNPHFGIPPDDDQTN